MSKSLSTNQELEIAEVVCVALNIQLTDDNLWKILEYIDTESIAEEWQSEIFES